MPERCIDACVAIKWVVKGEPWCVKARKLLQHSVANKFILIAPPLVEYEIESIFQKQLQRGEKTIDEVDTAIDKLSKIEISICTHPDMVKRARVIARQFNQLNVYDSLYAALADLRGCDLWTADKAFYEAVKEGLTFVKYLPNFQQ